MMLIPIQSWSRNGCSRRLALAQDKEKFTSEATQVQSLHSTEIPIAPSLFTAKGSFLAVIFTSRR